MRTRPIQPDDRVQLVLTHGGRPVAARVVMGTENGRALVLALEADVNGQAGQILFSGEVVAIQTLDGAWSLSPSGGGVAVPIALTRIES